MTIPLGSEGLTSDIFKRLTKEDLHFFLNISHSMEYSTAPDLYRTIKKIIENEFGDTVPEECKKNIVNINLYATQTKDILRHSVLAHEAGHVLVRFDSAYEECHRKIQNIQLAKIKEIIEDLFNKNPGINKILIEKEIIDVHASWIEEFFVDMVSVHAVGPAAFFAMKELSLEEWDFESSIANSHPAICKRVILMWSLLEKRGFVKHLTGEPLANAKTFVAWCEHFWTPTTQNPLHVILDNIFTKDILNQFIEEFSNASFCGGYTEAEFINEVPNLAKYLKEGIAAADLPDLTNKKFKDISGASLLNAAWLIEESNALETSKLNPVLNKALANLYLKNKWNSV